MPVAAMVQSRIDAPGTQPLEPAAGEEEHRPRRVRRRRGGEVVAHRLDLGVGRVRLIDGGEERAKRCIVSASRACLALSAFAFPRGADDAALEALRLQEAGERFGVAVRGQHAAGAGLGDRLEQRRPVGMIGQHEAAVERALPADAADAHQARDEAVGDIAEPPHPRRAAADSGASTSSPANDVPRGLSISGSVGEHGDAGARDTRRSSGSSCRARRRACRSPGQLREHRFALCRACNRRARGQRLWRD